MASTPNDRAAYLISVDKEKLAERVVRLEQALVLVLDDLDTGVALASEHLPAAMADQMKRRLGVIRRIQKEGEDL